MTSSPEKTTPPRRSAAVADRIAAEAHRGRSTSPARIRVRWDERSQIAYRSRGRPTLMWVNIVAPAEDEDARDTPGPDATRVQRCRQNAPNHKRVPRTSTV